MDRGNRLLPNGQIFRSIHVTERFEEENPKRKRSKSS